MFHTMLYFGVLQMKIGKMDSFKNLKKNNPKDNINLCVRF